MVVNKYGPNWPNIQWTLNGYFGSISETLSDVYECAYNVANDALVGQWFYWEIFKSERVTI